MESKKNVLLYEFFKLIEKKIKFLIRFVIHHFIYKRRNIQDADLLLFWSLLTIRYQIKIFIKHLLLNCMPNLNS